MQSNRYVRVAVEVFNYHRLNNEQLDRQLQTQRTRLRSIDTLYIRESEIDTIFEICLSIKEIKKVIKSREAKPSPFHD